ncbi:sulfate permease family domain-containing protein [Phthorimaea operculella]|nr:sulfate permease family domain-containing protein [Phthorimaea operculella]
MTRRLSSAIVMLPIVMVLANIAIAKAFKALGFLDMTRRLSSAIVMLPIVMVLANIAIAKAFSGGARVDATQEMLTLGLCNMAGSLFHGMPTCGAFTRSAVSHASGVRTPLAGLYSGLITLTALAFMTQYFFFIPKACLSSVLTCAVIFMIDYTTVLKLWRESKQELVVLLLTFLISLLGTVELALLAGALAALARVLRRVMRPPVPTHTYKINGGFAIVARPTLALLYLNTEYVSSKLAALAARARGPLLVDARDLSLIDHSAQQGLERLIKKLDAEEQQLVVYNAAHDTLRKLEGVTGLDTRALRMRTPADALQAVAGTQGKGGKIVAVPLVTDTEDEAEV